MKFDYEKLAKAMLSQKELLVDSSEDTLKLSKEASKDAEDKTKEKLENCQMSDDKEPEKGTKEEKDASESTDNKKDKDSDGVDTEGKTDADNKELPPSKAEHKKDEKMKASYVGEILAEMAKHLTK